MATKTPNNRRVVGGRLEDILVRNGAIASDALVTAAEEARAEGVRLEKYVVAQQLVTSVHMTLALAEYLEMIPISLVHFKPDSNLMESISKGVMEKHQVIPIARIGKSLTVALADPFDIVAMDELHVLTGLQITPLVASEKDVRDVLNRSFADEAKSIDMEDIMKQGEGEVEVGGQEEEEKKSLEEMMDGAEDAPVIRLVNMIIIEGLRMKAADIAIEPQEDFVRLRYKIDGAYTERPHLQKGMQSAIISRIKIMSDLDIGEQRLPQDGRFRITALGKRVDVRVSILPTIFGGRVVMRILDKSALFPSLSALGLDEYAFKLMNYAIAQPHGIVLVTGPTGSGKTTTLYSCLQELNKTDVNIVTCEDPVEYQLVGVNQVRIHTDVGLTFGAALRAILRQDPDIVLIGEIRDSETCEIAIKAALTGHLVLSTLHTNDAAGAVTRLIDMGVEPFLVASSVILSQAQRLYRELCPVCKKETEPNPQLMAQYKIDPKLFEGFKIYGAQGCPKCHNIGYSGRGSMMEVLPVDDDVRLAILQQASSTEIRDLAAKKGMLTLTQVGLMKVRDGLTSLEAAVRVTGGGD